MFRFIALCGALAAAPALAQTPAEFFAGKQIRMIIGHPAGADYDMGARLLARHLANHLPGKPMIVAQNMPAAGSIVAANYLALQAPRDGLAFGSFSRNIPNQAILGQANLEADPRKFNWLGGASLPARVCTVWETSPVKTMDEAFEKEALMAGAGPGASLSIIPTTLNHVLGTKFRVIDGYNGPNDAMLAMERGEVHGVCNSWNQLRPHAPLVAQGKVRVLFRVEEAAMASLPNTPSIYARAKTKVEADLLRFVFASTEFGRPYVLPPDVPTDRVAAFRAAFDAALADPALIAEAAQAGLDMTPRPAADLVSLLGKLYATPRETIETVKKIIPTGFN
jgi:tripartite-type tricarboxylate transporter receptor subunit TctC